MNKRLRISLANKCQLLFGAAVVLILTAALSVVWLRMQKLVIEGEQDTARRLANEWLAGQIEIGGPMLSVDALSEVDQGRALRLALLSRDQFEQARQVDAFLADAIERFEKRVDQNELFLVHRQQSEPRLYRYARAIRQSDLEKIRKGAEDVSPPEQTAAVGDPLQMLLLVQFQDQLAERRLALNRIYIVAAGLLAGLLAIGVFWFITMRLVLSPVRQLRDTAQRISEGNFDTRSELNTGDEFEELSEMFNHMLERLKNNQDQLRSINKSLDLKLGELAETNVALYEANKVKGEFLANVSHELRTPLNSIIGFAEVMQESLEGEDDPVATKRSRYVRNIISSSRQLLELINDLLDLAKIEAGRIELHVSPTSLADMLEGLLNLMKPQADKQQVELELKMDPQVPLVQTDPGKLQQILFNFLSNAVKFSPPNSKVTLAAAPEPSLFDPTESTQVRVSVTDQGPGIAPQDQQRIFEKFTQLDSTVTREHAGTGLGLTISQEMANLLRARIEVASEPGKGATFSVIVPVELQLQQAPLMPNLAADPLTS